MNAINTKTASSNVPRLSEAKALILNDIRAKWGKFSEDELSALENNDHLATQIVAKYSLDKAQAVRDVEAVLMGRQI